jgi:tetratricopeptide (TPR) repeat protein
MKAAARYILTTLFALLWVGSTYCQNDIRVNPQDIPNLSSSGKEQLTEKFSKGVTEYSAGNFKVALDNWLEIYNAGYRSADLEYNIGNAYFKLSNIPNAILFYERAYLLDPSDDNINYNLDIARTLTVDKFQAIPELFYSKWYDFISLYLHSNTWSTISITSFVLCLLFLSLYIYSSGYRIKVTGFWLALLLFFLSIFALTFSLHNKKLLYDSHKAIITTALVSGKSSPDTSGTDLFVLHEGTKVSIGDEVGEWYEITLSDGNKGWVPVNSLTII